MNTLSQRLLSSAGAVLLSAAALSVSGPAVAATSVTLYASPTGSGSTCSQASPCSLTGAQSAVRALAPSTSGADVTVNLLDGTYSLSATWAFGAGDSGSAGHPVVWQAAPGAHPVISGASQVTNWVQVGTSGVWSAQVPTGSATRQLYVNGTKAPIAQNTPEALGFNAAWPGDSSGYNISGDSAATAWFSGMTAAQVAGVEFNYPGSNGPWAHSRCRVQSYAAGRLTMTQPCWAGVTSRVGFDHASGGLPSMSPSKKPTLIENARSLLNPGQWFLDSQADLLYYQPLAGQQMNSLDVELPRLESLLQGAGTLASPLHDLTFAGLQFSYATWNNPSSPAGFADVQSNLRMTSGPTQSLCTFTSGTAPDGSCPWGSLTQPLANVAFTAAKNVTLTGNRFTGLGGAGLSVMYGSSNTSITDNEFTDIASTGILLGCTYDPNPVNAPSQDPDDPAVIKQNCTPNPTAVAADSIGTNEILTGTTVSNNVVHHIGTDYTSAPGITLLFSRNTTITHNNLYDLPYDGITAGVIQGHVDHAGDSQNSVNINQYNTISHNLIHDYLTQRADGGAIYVEGHQSQYVDANGNPTAYNLANRAQTMARGLQVTGNVAYNGHQTNFTYYDDAGAEWINWQGNAAFNAGSNATGGCSPTGHIDVVGNYVSAPLNTQGCAAPVDVNVSSNTTIPGNPGPGDIPSSVLSGAGVTAPVPGMANAGPEIRYTSPVSSANQVLIAGEGFGSNTQVSVNGTPLASANVTVRSRGLIVATVPAGTVPGQIRVSNLINDTDPSIAYSGFSYAGGRSMGDYGDDLHYATANNSTARYTFTGTSVTVYGEQYTDQGNIGVSVDGGTRQVVSTLPSDGRRHSDVALYSATGLSPGTHTIVVTKLSGTYATFDAVGVSGQSELRTDDTSPSIAYNGFSYSGGRGVGDYGDDIHYATANDTSTITLTFTGPAIKVYGEQYTDQGNIGVSIDGGTEQVVSTLPSDGRRHSDVAVYSATGLSPGTHTMKLTKRSGQYMTFDGFGTP